MEAHGLLDHYFPFDGLSQLSTSMGNAWVKCEVSVLTVVGNQIGGSCIPKVVFVFLFFVFVLQGDPDWLHWRPLLVGNPTFGFPDIYS